MRTAGEPRDAVRIIRCGVGTQSFFLEMDSVVHIQGLDRLRTKWTADGLGGLLKHGGGEIAVYRLARLLDLPDDRETWKHILLLESKGRRWGILVDNVSRVLSVPAGGFDPLPELVERSARVPFKGVVRLDQPGAEAKSRALPGSLALRLDRADADEPAEAGRFALLIDPDRLDPDAESEEPLAEFAEAVAEGSRPATTPGPDALGGGRGQLLAFSVTDPRQGRDVNPSVALSLSQVLEIHDPTAILPVPKAPPYLMGLIPWRDELLPVVDLASRLGLPPFRSKGRPRLVVARAAHDERIAFPIHPGILSLRLPKESVACESPVPLDLRLTRGVFMVDQATLVVPNLSGILTVR
jgi:purine-binding chemotaxis protein CheW